MMEEWANGTDSKLLNGSFDTDTSIPYAQRVETYLVSVIFGLIFIVGVLGNGTLILVFLRHANMRNVPNTYIFSLAVGDLFVIFACVPFTAVAYTVPSYPFGELFCKFSECAKDVSIGVSVFTLTALSADRFFAIVDPMRTLHTGGGRATRFTIVTALSIWALAIVCTIPAAIFTHLQIFPLTATLGESHIVVCYPFPVEITWYAKTNVVIKFFVYYAIPLCIIGCFYLLMARHLIQSTLNIPGEMHGQARQVRARRKVAKMVLAFVIIFAVCFFPHHVFMIWFHTNPTSEMDYNGFWHTFRIVAFCLSFINSCINPIALYCVSGAFRKHFNRYLLCCFKRLDADDGGGGMMRGGGGGGGGGGNTASSSKRAASRRFNSKSTWDSTTLAQFQHHNSTVRRHPQQSLLLQQQDDVTVTTFINGRGGGGGGGNDADVGKKAEPQIMTTCN